MKLLLLLPLLFSMETNELNQENFKEIVLGGGCFWCIEAVFEDVKGVENIINGYSGGKIKNPSYREVSNSKTNHAEVCKIIYDEEKINLNRF